MLGLPACRHALTICRWTGGHLFGSHLDSEITARDHHRIRESHDGVEVFDGGGLLQLRHHPGAPGDNGAYFFDILRTLNERQRDPVCAELKTVGQINSVFGRQSGERQDGADDADPFAIGQHAADENPSHCLIRTAGLHLQPDLAVVEQQLHPGSECLEDLRMGQADPLLVSGSASQIEAKLRAGGQDHTAGSERAEPQLRPLQVHENSDRPSNVLLDGPDEIVALLVILVGAVAEVQAEHIRSRVEQAADDFRAGACRSQGGDDLGVAVTAHSMSRPARPAFLVLRERGWRGSRLRWSASVP